MGLAAADGVPADWPLLLAGAGNPIGKRRVKEAAEGPATQSGPLRGFTGDEVAERGDALAESLASEGLWVAGSSGVQGEWPKILLTRAGDGRLRPDPPRPTHRGAVGLRRPHRTDAAGRPCADAAASGWHRAPHPVGGHRRRSARLAPCARPGVRACRSGAADGDGAHKANGPPSLARDAWVAALKAMAPGLRRVAERGVAMGVEPGGVLNPLRPHILARAEELAASA